MTLIGSFLVTEVYPEFVVAVPVTEAADVIWALQEGHLDVDEAVDHLGELHRPFLARHRRIARKHGRTLRVRRTLRLASRCPCHVGTMAGGPSGR